MVCPRLVRRYKALGTARLKGGRGGRAYAVTEADTEGILGQDVGRLLISYYRPLRQARDGRRRGAGDLENGVGRYDEPQCSHIKLTVVDGEYTVLGSGNMDRASWYTSQELGILFQDASMAKSVKEAVDGFLDGRLECAFDSNNG